MSERQRDILLMLCLCAVVVIPFWPARSVEFMPSWDDGETVTGNPFLRKGVSDGLAPLVMRPYEYLYVPLTYMVYWAAFHMWDLNPYYFHLVNVFVHAANALLVYLIFRRLFSGRILPGVAALWWGLHPLDVEAVAWVTGLKDVLSAFFMLLSFLFYMAWRDGMSEATNSGRRVWLWIVSIVSFMLACFSKPNAAAFPLALVGYDLFMARCKWRKLWPVIPYFVFTVAIMAVTVSIQKLEEQPIAAPLNIVERLRVAGDTSLFYLGKLAWPAGLCAIYGRKASAIANSGWSWASLLGAVALFGVALLLGKRWRMGAAIYIAGLAPASGIVPFLYQSHSTVADRYIYFPSIGVALIAADIVSRFGFTSAKRLNKWGMAGVVGLAVWAGCLGFVAKRQTAFWHDSISLWQRVVDIKPTLAQAHCSLGVAWVKKRNYKLGIEYCTRAIQLDPFYAKGYGNLGPAYNGIREYDLAIKNCTRAIELDRKYTDAYHNRAVAYYFKKEYDKAWADVKQCQTLGGAVNPNFLNALRRDSGRPE